MPKLFVEKSVDIKAPAARVWRVLTDPQVTKKWIRSWWPDIVSLDSDWEVGSTVLWKVAKDKVGAAGTVTLSEPEKMLRYGFKINQPESDKQEIITYKLEERNGTTRFSVWVGDFGDSEEHQECYPGALESWEKSLSKIKELSEK